MSGVPIYYLGWYHNKLQEERMRMASRPTQAEPMTTCSHCGRSLSIYLMPGHQCTCRKCGLRGVQPSHFCMPGLR